MAQPPKVDDLSQCTPGSRPAALGDFPSAAPPHLVQLNVGGEIYDTTATTLLSEESLLAQWFRSGFADLPRTSSGAVYINRDGRIFRHVLNYLRGYKIHVPEEDIALLAEDAKYYGLMGLLKQNGMQSPSEWRFAPGPGVSTACTRFCSQTEVGYCGDEFHSSGMIVARWRLEKCDVAAIGLVSPMEDPDQGKNFKLTEGSCCYINTGEIWVNFDKNADEKCFDHQIPRFREGDDIHLCLVFKTPSMVDLTFFKGDQTVFSRVITADKPLSLRPAVFIEGTSIVHLTKYEVLPLPAGAGEISGEPGDVSTSSHA